MEVVFIVGAVQAFFITFLVFTKRDKSVGDYVLTTLLLIMGMMLIGHTFEVKGIDVNLPIYLGFYSAMPVLIGPLIYLYTIVLTGEPSKINPWFILHFLPYVVFTFFVFAQLTLFSEGTVAADKNVIEDTRKPIFKLMELWRIFASPVYLVICLFVLKKHTQKIGKYFSYTEYVDLKWLKYVVVFTMGIFAIVITVNIVSNFNHFIDYKLGDNIIFIALTVIIFLNGYYGIKQQVIFSPTNVKSKTQIETSEETRQEIKQYTKSGLTKEDSKYHLKRLRQYMEDEQPYLNGKLSLKEVAEKLELSNNHVSQLINENLGKNFYDFVNGYRIEMVKKKMANKSNEHYTILAIAFDCGFNSKSSFNAIFKRHNGVTPSQYLKSLE